MGQASQPLIDFLVLAIGRTRGTTIPTVFRFIRVACFPLTGEYRTHGPIYVDCALDGRRFCVCDKNEDGRLFAKNVQITIRFPT